MGYTVQDYDELRVEMAERSYTIKVGENLLSRRESFDDALSGPVVVIVSNETIAPLYLDTLKSALAGRKLVEHILPDGEQHKRLEAVAAIIDTAVAAGAARDCTFVALGGGVVGDMTGFAAATFMRGVDFIQVPTTLLAQVDSSVGGKTGVNHAAGKNLIGAFHQPSRVVIDTQTLATLPAREFAAGLAEVIKYGLIIDAEFFDWLEANAAALLARDTIALRYAILHSCKIKAQVVSADEHERGQRALLNFGHTFGHAIEATTGFSSWLHGEAVAAGMVMAARMSAIAPEQIDRLCDLLKRVGLPIGAPAKVSAEALLSAMGHDKKVQAGKIRLVLLRELGEAYLTDSYDTHRLNSVLAQRDV